MVARLRALDEALLTAVLGTLSEAVRAAADVEAKEALGPFRDRMIPETYQRARAAAIQRHVRDHFWPPHGSL